MSASSPSLRSGGCQCGAVRYQISSEALGLFVCHCRECQKQSASAFGVSQTVRRADFRIIRGAVKLYTRTSATSKTVRCLFCADCGSRLWHEYDSESPNIGIKAGSLDQPVDITGAIHIWISRKLPGVVIPNGAVQFAEEPS